MRRILLILAALLAADLADASSNRGAPKQTIMVGGVLASGAAMRQAVNICLVPDIQNLTSQDDGSADSPLTCAMLQDQLQCVGSYCESSIYCANSWRNTGRIFLANLAYDLTGQWSRIDWSAVRGNDLVAKSRLTNGPDHPPCDVIIGLGDSMDTADELTYAQLNEARRWEYGGALMFWGIVRDSGIPFFIARGNHDGEGVFDTLLTEIGVTGLPFYYDGHSEGDVYAIKFPTNAQKDFCVISIDDNVGGGVGDQYTASEASWVLANSGCGTGLPTILVGHEIVNLDANAILETAATDVVGVAGHGEVLLVAGGHYTSATPVSRKVAGTNFDTNAIFKFFSNWQEQDRHSTGAAVSNTPYGTTPSDGCGAFYTMVRIDPLDQTLTAWDWSPYWMSRSVYPGCGTGTLTSTYSVTFDFNGRFP